jgi:hypothetical protein
MNYKFNIINLQAEIEGTLTDVQAQWLIEVDGELVDLPEVEKEEVLAVLKEQDGEFHNFFFYFGTHPLREKI